MYFRSIKRALGRSYEDVLQHHILQVSAALSYYFVLSVFPSLIFLSAVVRLIPLPDLFGHVLGLMGKLLPADSMRVVSSVLNDVLSYLPSPVRKTRPWAVRLRLLYPPFPPLGPSPAWVLRVSLAECRRSPTRPPETLRLSSLVQPLPTSFLSTVAGTCEPPVWEFGVGKTGQN